MNSDTHANNIPVLTEVIAIETVTEATPNTHKAHNEVSAPSHLMTEQALEELKKTLHENVLRQLLTRVDFVLEHRIKDGLAEVLQTAVDDLATTVRQGLNKSLEELIHRTINQEISKVESLKSKQNSSTF